MLCAESPLRATELPRSCAPGSLLARGTMHSKSEVAKRFEHSVIRGREETCGLFEVLERQTQIRWWQHAFRVLDGCTMLA